MLAVFGGIKCDAEPSEPFDNPAADRDRIFAYAGRKYEGVEPLERSRQHPRVEPDPVHEIIDGERCARVSASLEFSHVVADAGQTLQTAVAVEELLYLWRR